MTTNAKRINQAESVVDAYGDDSDANCRTKLIDLLADLRHAATYYSVDFTECLHQSRLHFEKEKE